jgi:hypothetical protein
MRENKRGMRHILPAFGAVGHHPRSHRRWSEPPCSRGVHLLAMIVASCRSLLREVLSLEAGV